MNTVTIESVKREAKAISRATTISHSQALDVLAVQAGHSHWGSYQSSISENLRLAAERRKRTISPMDLLSEIIGQHDYLPPAIREARHMVISGGTSTGKTTLLQRLLDFVPACSPIAMLERHPEVMNRRSAEHLGIAPLEAKAGAEKWLEAHVAATHAGAGTIVWDEISMSNGPALITALRTPFCPTILTTIHATTPRDAANAVFERSRGERVTPEDGVLCVQMTRDMTGRRCVTEIALL